MNNIFTKAIIKGSSRELLAIVIVQLITGKTPNPAGSNQSIILIHFDHKLRDGLSDCSNFILCPSSAKHRLTFHNLSTDTQKDFFKLLQNTGSMGEIDRRANGTHDMSKILERRVITST